MKIITSILILLSSVTISFSQEKEKINWESDINFLKQMLPQKHINIFFSTSERDFHKKLEEIKAGLPEMNDLQVAIKIQQVIASMGDSHTNSGWVKFLSRDKKLNVRTYWFKEGLYITSAITRDSVLLGKRVLKIGGVDIGDIINDLKTMFVDENKSLTKHLIPYYLTFGQLLNYFGCKLEKDGYFEFEVVDETNKIFKHLVKLGVKGKVLHYNIASNQLLNGSKDWFVEKYNERDGVYFLQYNRCDSKDLAIKFSRPQLVIDRSPSFNEFKQKVLKTISERNIKKFIFDMRYNVGGSSTQGTEFIKEISKIKEVNKKGKLFVLIGRKTFSSAILNTLDFKKKTKAIAVGEETGGKASHFGEIRSFRLPNSGLKITYSTKYFYCNRRNRIKVYRSRKGINTKKDKRKSIIPDNTVELSFEDFKKNSDPVLKWIEHYVK